MSDTAPTAIYGRMISIMRDLEAIGKNSKNQAQGFNYRGIDSVYNALHPLMSKHGVFMAAEILEKTREERVNAKGTVLAFTMLRMRYKFITDDGSFVETVAEGEGMDSGDKSSNKAMAVAHKYALLQAFCIPTEDIEDPDAQSHTVAQKGVQAQRNTPPSPPGAVEPPMPAAPKKTPSEWLHERIDEVNAITSLNELTDFENKYTKHIALAQNKEPEMHQVLVDAIQAKQIDLF